ncbi:MAG: molecular chaperone Skp [Piscirickettsiaceae bacterium CG_4_9_14_3_um_filter_43_564]|nr:OmpH family outer membrane protein [Thiomicrospira sp.]OIP94256.1 MAG: molecular chaperone Skp [Thiomicrospira sp. CG2_30_44_34]PIQ02772.1 MAG: molecular chaperone Skp [Piscirickettsiaceae bacterium CG18_big_fil_WC_8_21_14_2_50_44_103]PIU38586.1 MAG: molecular chaperone Skp [Piscirickettsiaceae bacterium CG07_land_8_20_14_0_80_44_28]PIW58443.1 MAG: molecular chaperone Skp [Piscirickettsiaceae bacterium CG12_big_fil_rev_8_21_14_0_65_44_934]PIW78731.1 MAG: molecular chaperone Skp [Pisciricket
MHKRLIAILSVLLWVVATQVQAQSVKLGVVNVGMLLEKAPQAQAAGKSLEKEFGPQQTELKRMAAKLEQMQQDYQKNQLILSESQKAASEREITMMTRDIQRKRNDIQELVNIRRNEELASLQNEVNKAIRIIGEQQAYDLILYEGIAYTNNRLDITEAVLKYLEKEYRSKRDNFNQ